ncbi:uncharacterized protein LOC135092925 [Scylla paramamosain]|uniref:uncharacterized protein LOC135092925 n=1 Tax=Scylla paramamosain TaxID=85552 RepID=UPI0030835688
MDAVLGSRRLLRAAYPILRPWQRLSPVTPASVTHVSSHAQEQPREKNVVYSSFPSMALPTQDLPHLLYERLQKWRHLDAMECSVTGRKYTYGEVLDKGLRFGGIVNTFLPPASSSASPEEKIRTVTFFSQNCPEFPIFLLGTLATGATLATINSNYTAAEVARQLAHSEAGLVVTEPLLEGMVREALVKLGKDLPVVVNGVSQQGYPNVRDMLDDPARPFCDLVQTHPEDMAVMLFSSGTTGPPKGVQLSHRAFTSNLTFFTHPKIFPYHPSKEGEAQEVVTGLTPFYHVNGLYLITLIGMYQGAKVVSFPAFDPVSYVRVIREHKIGILHLVPPILNFLTMSDKVTSADLASVRGAICAAAPVPSTTSKLFKEKAPNPIIFQEGFGMTEILGSHMTPLDDERLGYCGKVVPNVMAKVINAEGEALPEGERGELCIKSPSLMTGYYKNPTVTAQTLDAEGWLHTGDVAIHTDGFFSIVDRLKELIKVKGFQVSSSELEDVLLEHTAVADVAVIGIPDDRAGELPRAYIVRSSSSSCSEEDIHGFLKERVAEFKQLKGGVRFVDALPKNQTGKVLKRELQELAAKEG